MPPQRHAAAALMPLLIPPLMFTTRRCCHAIIFDYATPHAAVTNSTRHVVVIACSLRCCRFARIRVMASPAAAMPWRQVPRYAMPCFYAPYAITIAAMLYA